MKKVFNPMMLLNLFVLFMFIILLGMVIKSIILYPEVKTLISK
ncbi:MAG: hypothetical protein PHY93_18205 [Bacteriovorax sp.]|nr:hypothetical protein [Bacteriovorax sp.]